MFVQVIKGKVSNAEELDRQLDRWVAELRPNAPGFLGSTSGVTADGTGINFARFDSAEAAAANAARSEQGQWWGEVEKCFDGPVTFRDSTDVELYENGDLDSATFVQVMEGRITDRAAANDLLTRAEPMLREGRPDLLGTVTVFHTDGTYSEVAYFASEADARAGESQEPPAEAAAMMEEWSRLFEVSEFLDLHEPRLI
jgi:hypothetical protein